MEKDAVKTNVINFLSAQNQRFHSGAAVLVVGFIFSFFLIPISCHHQSNCLIRAILKVHVTELKNIFSLYSGFFIMLKSL